jgi:hypothetical protein
MSDVILRDAERTNEIAALSAKKFGSAALRVRDPQRKSFANVPAESRYYGHEVITVASADGREFRTIETWEMPSVPVERSGADRFFFVDAAYSYRSDLISNAVHGTPTYWWWILISNGLSDDVELKVGLTLRVLAPPIERAGQVSRRPF